MEKSITEMIKDSELFMVAQFIDVMEVLEKYKKIGDVKKDIKNRKKIYFEYINTISESNDFWELDLYNSTIDSKIEKCSKIYLESNKYQDTLEDLDKKYKILIQNLKKNDQNELDEIKGLIYDLCDFDVQLAYKIGLIEGIKIKNKCT